jgi:hypothetical protein
MIGCRLILGACFFMCIWFALWASYLWDEWLHKALQDEGLMIGYPWFLPWDRVVFLVAAVMFVFPPCLPVTCCPGQPSDIGPPTICFPLFPLRPMNVHRYLWKWDIMGNSWDRMGIWHGDFPILSINIWPCAAALCCGMWLQIGQGRHHTVQRLLDRHATWL